jgi:DNA polymerase
MIDVLLESETDFDAWRQAARRLRMADAPPQSLNWRVGDGAPPLFADPLPEPSGPPVATSRAFIDLAKDVILHRAEERFDLLYRMLWRLRDAPRLIEIASDEDVAKALRMQKAVRQAIHKMHAFVRFRRMEGAADETYVAWFEPAHRVAMAASDWFVARMANVRFSILTPEVSLHWDGRALATSAGVDRGAAPDDDAMEDYWRTYYASVFNPARLNPRLMIQHMPRKYWRSLPETAAIPDLVSRARGRTEAMVSAGPTEPSRRAERIAERRRAETPPETADDPRSLDDIAAGVQGCRRCPLWRDATQGVPGEGPSSAAMMMVGEQPGDQEDLAGHPFVGPAGAILDKALAAAGVPRGELYVTNAVKHFKHELRGKLRLHKTPNTGEARACRWWLDHERSLVRPKVILALGATAAQAVLGRPVSVMKERGEAVSLADGATGFITVHPSFLLRIPDEAAKAAAYRDFVADIHAAFALAGAE